MPNIASTVTVDAFLVDHQIERIDFFKMDVQGAEYEILLGAADAIKEALAIMCEVEFVALRESTIVRGRGPAVAIARLHVSQVSGLGGESHETHHRQ